MSEYFVSTSLQSVIDYFVVCVFTVSTVLSALTFFCLFKTQISSQTTMRNNLIYIQIVIFLNEVYQDVLFDGVPLFPLLSIYCNGFLCYLWKFPVISGFGIVVLLIGQVGVVILMCFVQRHQSILLPGHTLKFSKFNVAWIRERGKMYVMTEKSTGQDVVVILILSILLLATIFVVAIIIHITYELLSEMTAPFTCIIVPASIIMSGLVSDNFVSFEVSLASYCIMHFHSFAHSAMIFALTPPYRRFILGQARWILRVINAGRKFGHIRVRTAPSETNI